MTNQEIFDVVSKGMLSTLKKGRSKYSKWGTSCNAYIGDDGNRCGLGLLIPPHVGVSNELNTLIITQPQVIEFFTHHNILSKEQSYLCSQTMSLLVELQSTHDNDDIEDWYERLLEIAQSFHLTMPSQHITQSVDTLVKCSDGT